MRLRHQTRLLPNHPRVPGSGTKWHGPRVRTGTPSPVFRTGSSVCSCGARGQGHAAPTRSCTNSGGSVAEAPAGGRSIPGGLAMRTPGIGHQQPRTKVARVCVTAQSSGGHLVPPTAGRSPCPIFIPASTTSRNSCSITSAQSWAWDTR